MMMSKLQKIADFLSNNYSKTSSEDQLTNAEIEKEIDEDEAICAYVQHRNVKVDSRMAPLKQDRVFPLAPSAKIFTDTDKIKKHIKSRKGGEKYQYYFNRSNKEVKKVILQAFNERKCEELKAKKQEAQKELEEAEEKIEELCE